MLEYFYENILKEFEAFIFLKVDNKKLMHGKHKFFYQLYVTIESMFESLRHLITTVCVVFVNSFEIKDAS